eukprot:364303-Chlamydomonas_euryale.AAC.7
MYNKNSLAPHICLPLQAASWAHDVCVVPSCEAWRHGTVHRTHAVERARGPGGFRVRVTETVSNAASRDLSRGSGSDGPCGSYTLVSLQHAGHLAATARCLNKESDLGTGA